jgi:2-C-methyl-D-erythritol 4-phosphate cytidylyltransferase
MRNRVIAIVPAAGSGTRFGSSQVKTYASLLGKPLLIWPLEVLQKAEEIDEIVLVVREQDLDAAGDLADRYRIEKLKTIVPGGAERQDSVCRALEEVRDPGATLLIHDGARPLVEPVLVKQAVAALSGCDGVVVAVPVKDTVKEAAEARAGTDCRAERWTVRRTLDRRTLWAVQTPQVFRCETLLKAYQRAWEEEFRATDDASLVERYGGTVEILMGSYRNIKITTPDDLVIAEALLRSCVSA